MATAGQTKPHPCLTTDWVLVQFSRKQGKAEQEYRQFVQWGIGQKTIWTEVRGQSILGDDTFMDKLSSHLKKHKDIPEIPRSQRYAARPLLVTLLPEGIVDDKRNSVSDYPKPWCNMATGKANLPCTSACITPQSAVGFVNMKMHVERLAPKN